MLGYALTGSFCTISRSLAVLKKLTESYDDILPIISPSVSTTDTRFGTAAQTEKELISLCGREPIKTIKDAEPLGPKTPLSALVICPCTGNTLAKLANGITDTSVTMAAKAQLRADRPLIIAVATNDALSQNLKNIASLITRKNVYLVPFGQDDPINKPHSLISDFTLLEKTLEEGLEHRQLQPVLLR